MKNNSVHTLEYRYMKILSNAKIAGVYRSDRTGVGCKSLFNQSLSWRMDEGYFPMITGRKMYQNVFKTEFDWFLNGETNIRRFQDAGVKIWDAWADDKGDLGPVYGYQMLNFNNQSVNQLEAVVKEAGEAEELEIELTPFELPEIKPPKGFDNNNQ